MGARARLGSTLCTAILLTSGASLAAPSVSWRASAPVNDCSGPTDSTGNAWSDPMFDDAAWVAVSLPAHNDIPAARDRYYRGTFVADGYASATISFDSDDGAWVYVNGTFRGHWGGGCHVSGCVGQTGGCSGQRVYLDISSALVLGVNVVAIHVSNSSASGSYANLYFTNYTVTSLPLDLLRPEQNDFCQPTCLFDWVPAPAAVSKYVLSTDGVVRKDNIPSSFTEYALTVGEQLADGAHVWTVQGCDGAGTCTPSPNTFTVNIDGTPPAPFLPTEPADHAWQSRAILFNFEWAPTSDGASATPSGLERYELSIDGHLAVSVSSADPGVSSNRGAIPSLLTEGDHSWEVAAFDAVGNRVVAAGRTLRIDSTPPTFSAFEPVPPDVSWTTDTRPTVQWELATDGGSGVATQYVLLDFAARFDANSGATSLAFPIGLADGMHTWQVVAIDQAGNESQSNFFRFGVDTTAPVGLRLNGVTPGTADGAVISSLTPTLCWVRPTDAGVGLGEYRLYLNGLLARGAIAPASVCTTPSQGLIDGVYHWRVDVLDILGNSAPSLETFTFTVETQTPEAFELLTPAGGVMLFEARPTFSWTASVDRGVGLDHYEVSVDNGAAGVCPTPCIVPAAQTTFIPTNALGVGPHSWLVTAVDKAGKRRQTGPQTFGVVATPSATTTATDTSTRTPTNTATRISTGTATSMPTPTSTGTPSRTTTVTPTAGDTAIASATRSDTASTTPTLFPTSTASTTGSSTFTPTATVSATSSVTHSTTSTPNPSPTTTRSGTATITITGTATRSQTATPTPSATPSPSPSPLPTHTPPECVGDCNGNGAVAVNELVRAVGIALGPGESGTCVRVDADANGTVSINELIAAVRSALNGCAG